MALLAPAASSASTVALSPGTITYTGGAAASSLTVSVSGSNYQFADMGDPITSAVGCTVSARTAFARQRA